jgi:cob(I)alamin adenosyltransferase
MFMDKTQLEQPSVLEGYKTKGSVVLVYTGDSKGKTSAGLGLVCRALGNGWKVAFVQFIKYWEVGEHRFLAEIAPNFGDKLTFYKGGKGFYNAGAMSAKDISADEHRKAAEETYTFAFTCAASGAYDLVVCDEINNAVHDGLLTELDLADLVTKKHQKTSLCLTGRHFPKELLLSVDIATNMSKIKHHFDDKFLANQGIDY